MSEGPEVRRTADRIAEALLGRALEVVELRKRSTAPGDQLVPRLVGANVKAVRRDSRERLVLATTDTVAVEFNGSILRFTKVDPATESTIERLGLDALATRFSFAAARRRLRERSRKNLADLLLDQTFVAGVGNKYKSAILFLERLHPFRSVGELDEGDLRRLVARIRSTLRSGYEEGGRTRPLEPGESGYQWNTKHWAFRRGRRPCWRCGERIRDRSSSSRVTYWCPVCQAEAKPARVARRA